MEGVIEMARGGLAAHWHKPERAKACILCGEHKPLTDFYAYGYTTRQGKRSTRYESRCKPCAVERRRAEYDPEKERAQYARWRASNPEHRKKYAEAYRASEHGRRTKARLQRLRKARMRSGEGDTPEIRAIYAEAMRVEAVIQECPVFDIPELGKKIHVDHIIPLAKGGSHDATNLQLLPAGLNMRKGAS